MMTKKWLPLCPVLGLMLMLTQSCSLFDPDRNDWPMWRYDASRSGASPHELSDSLNVLWVREYSKPKPTWDDPLNQDLMQFDTVYEPIVHRQTLFLGSNESDCLIALDTETGEERWRYYVDGPVRFPPVAADGRVYFTSDDGNLYCLNAQQGTLSWKFRGAPSERDILGNERLISSWPARGGPVLKDGVVYFCSGIWPFMGIFIFALDAETGEVIWQNDSTGPKYMLQPHNSPAYAGVAPQGSLVISGDKLLVPCGRSVPACFDLKTGELLYYRLAENGKTGGAFVAAHDEFFVNYHRDSVVSLYQLSSGDSVIRSVGKVPVVTEDRLFCRGDSITALNLGSVSQRAVEERIVFDRKSGGVKSVTEKEWTIETLWNADVDASGDLIQAGSKLFAGGKKVISAVSIPERQGDPEVIWQTTLEGTVGRLIVGDRKLFAVTREGRIYAFGDDNIEPRSYPYRTRKKLGEKTVAYAQSVLSAADVKEGYCLAYGISDPGLVQAMAQNSDLNIVVVESDPGKVEKFRREYDSAGLLGRKVSVYPGDLKSFTPPPYLASLIIIEDLEGAGFDGQKSTLQKIFTSLRPYGGRAYIQASEQTGTALHKQLQELQLPRSSVQRIRYEPSLLQGVKDAGKKFGPSNGGGALGEEVELAAASLRSEGAILWIRSGALPGAADWTHQYGDVANTVKSDDQLVKLPLGILWFGGSSNTDVLPRHGHGPPEQVVGGRLFIEGMSSMSARDVYSGRVLWKRAISRLDTSGIYYDHTYKDTPLDTAYNQVHIPGANARGTNFVATEDKIYLALKRSCLVLDPETGKTIDEFTLPPERGSDEQPEWAYIGVYEDYLLAGADFAPYLDFLELDELDPRMKTQLNSFYNFDITASRRLVVMDRHTGEVLWSRKAKLGFWHNAIVAADDKIFCIDRLPPSVTTALEKRLGEFRFSPPELSALHVRDGRVAWEKTEDVFGTWLSYSEEHGTLVQAGRSSRDMIRGEPEGLMALKASNGNTLWRKDVSDGGPYILHGSTIITERTAYSLLTGEQEMRSDPLTGEEAPWVIRRDYGCNYIVGSEHLLTFRSAAAGFYDLSNDGGTGTFGGFRSSCTSNLIAANGVLNAPDYTRTCSCSYQNQTSLALIHMPELEMWTTFYGQPKASSITNASSAALFADLDSKITYGNEAFLELFEYKELSAIEGLDLSLIWADPEEGRESVESLRRARSWTGLVTAQTEDGKSIEVHVLARVLTDETLAPVALMLLIVDADESSVAFADLQGDLTYVNHEFVEMWLFTNEREARARPFDQLWKSGRNLSEAITAWRAGRDWSGELSAIRDDGATNDLYVTTRFLSNENGQVVSVVITCFDVDERKELLLEARSLVRELGSGANIKYFLTAKEPIQRVGINFGAPGDRKADNGTLWLEYPEVGGASPEVSLSLTPEEYTPYNHHTSRIEGDGPAWVFASGVIGVSSITLRLADSMVEKEIMQARPYDVYLYFAEPAATQSGQRLLDVSVQGKKVLDRLDIIGEAGGSNQAISKKISGVLVKDELTIELAPSEDSSINTTLISGIEVIAQSISETQRYSE